MKLFTLLFVSVVGFLSLGGVQVSTSYGETSRNMPYCHNPVGMENISITFSRARYPNISAHMLRAQRAHPVRLRLERSLATLHRHQSLNGVPTVPGMDRDEYPPAMTSQGGTGADIEYVPATENRSSGAWMRAQLRNYPDLWCVRFLVGN